MSFYEKYILLNLKDYDVFGNFDFYVTAFIALLTVGVCVGVFLSNHRKNAMILMLKQLKRHGAISPESAKTLAELGIKPSGTLKRLLDIGARLSRTVLAVGRENISYEEYVASLKSKKKKKKSSEEDEDAPTASLGIDFETDCFYINPERDDDANSILRKSTTTVWQNVLMCVFFFAIAVCLTLLMPEILSLLSDWLQ